MNELLDEFQSNELRIQEYEAKISLAISGMKEQQEILQKQNEELKEKIKLAMEQNNIKKYENDMLSITYISPSKRKSVDATKLKEEYEDIYLECLKEINVKSSIRIKLK